MSRPVKWRRVVFLPRGKGFVPLDKPGHCLEEVVLKVEELEAIRLKDLEKLNQEQCARSMNISRQTFQLIIDEARRKMAQALVEGKAISIRGGNYTINICRYRCLDCGFEFEIPYEEENRCCPACSSENIQCIKHNGFCKKRCRRRWNDSGEL